MIKVGTLVMFTDKAVKKGVSPADRVFGVVASAGTEGGVKTYSAWKHSISEDGQRVIHAGTLEALSPTDPKLFAERTDGGSVPTGEVYDDSFYTKADLAVILKRHKALARSAKAADKERATIDAFVKQHREETVTLIENDKCVMKIDFAGRLTIGLKTEIGTLMYYPNATSWSPRHLL